MVTRRAVRAPSAVVRFVLPLGVLTALSVFASSALAQMHSVPPERPSKNDDSPKEDKKDPREGKKRLDPKPRHQTNESDDAEPTQWWWGSSSSSASSSSTGSATSSGDGYSMSAQGVPLRALIGVGGHVSLAGPALRETAKPVGFGPDMLVLLGAERFPLLFGAQFGFDWFGSDTRRFQFDGQTAYWDIDRRSFWLHAVVRLQPTTGILRPHVDLLGGLWGHDVTIDLDGVIDDDDPFELGKAHSGSYGFAAGLDVVLPSKLFIGMGAMHLRGGRIRLPNVNDLAVVNNELYYGEIYSRPIYQWTFMLNLGFVSK